MKRPNIFASLAGCMLLASLCSSALAQTATLIRATDTFSWAIPSPDPTGIVFVPGANGLFITDSEVEETVLFSGSNMFQTELDGSVAGLFSTLDFTPEPTGITINPDNNHLFIAMDDSPRLIFEINPGIDGIYRNGDDTITSFNTTDFSCYDAEGITYNPVDEVLHIACGVSDIIYTVDPGPNQLFDGVAPTGDDTVTGFDTSALGLTDPEGIAYDSASGSLYIIGKPKTQLLHVTTDGQFIRTITLDSSLLYKPAGLSMGDSSLNNGAQSLYLVDRGVDNDSNPDENDGRLLEFALPSQFGNESPSIQISAPSDGEIFQNADSISFVSLAVDQEDGDLSSAVKWHSDINGALGSGGTLTTSSLSVGLHEITASCADSSLAQALDVIQIRVLPEGSAIVQARIDSSSDDAEQRGPDGNTWTSGNDLELIYDNSVAQIVGLRFNALSIPAGALIEEATIQFQADETQSSPVLMEIRAQDIGNAEPILARRNNLTDRNTTAASSIWQPDDWRVVGEAGQNQKTSDLSALVQEVVNRQDWSEGNSMAFLLSGSSTARRTAVSFDSDPAAAPLLQVRYSLISQIPVLAITSPLDGTVSDNESPVNLVATATDPQEGDLAMQVSWASDIDGALGTGNSAVTLTAGLHTITATVSDTDGNAVTSSVSVRIENTLSPGTFLVESRISSSTDDAEQRGVDGNTWVDGDDLELVYDASIMQTIGLRFNALSIPAGALIEEATIQFQTDESHSSPVLMEIRAQASDDAEPILGRKNNLTNRSTTTAFSTWAPADWLIVGEAGLNQKTSDLSALVQEVITRPGWTDGNSMAFLITGTSATRRTAESFDGNPAAAPLLQVRYSLLPRIPVLSITSPLDGTQSDDESPVNLSATATDPQDGDLAMQVSWSSSLDGELGTGNGALILTAGLHTISASVSDADGNTVTDSVTVQIESAQTPDTFLVESRISSSNDDAEQRGLDGNTWIDGDDLELVYDASIAQIVGLRFNALSIPAGVFIEEAYIQFQADETHSSPVPMQIRAQASDDAEPILGRRNNLTNRSTTTAFSTWAPEDWQVLGESGINQRTSDLSALVQEVVNRSGWSHGNSMAFLISGNSTARRTAESFDGDPAAAPLLRVRYSLTPQRPALAIASPLDGSLSDDASLISLSASATDPQDGDLASQVSWASSLDGALGTGNPALILTQGLHTITATVSDADGNIVTDSVTVHVYSAEQPGTIIIEARVNSSTDDAEQRGVDGNTWTDGNDLELIYDNSVAQIVGLRFNALSIPADATIQEAYIQFQADETQSEPVLLEIKGQASANAEPILARKNNLSNRSTTTASSTWEPGPWQAVGESGVSQRTTDLSALVQEIIDQPGWSPGNSMAFMVTGSSTTRRTAESYDSEPAAAPLLHIRYAVPLQTQVMALKTTAPAQTPALEVSDFSVASTEPAATVSTDERMIESATASPDLVVTSPLDGSQFDDESYVNLSALALDSLEHDLSDGINWMSDLEGVLGTGNTAVVLSSGLHTITATVSDADGNTMSKSVVVQVDPADDTDITTLSVRIEVESDDAEEHANGLVDAGNGVLALAGDGIRYQQTGLRFNDMQIPANAGILSAVVQFQAAESSDELTFLTLTAQDGGNPESFDNSDYDLSSRPEIAADVSWLPPPWSQGSAGAGQQTPDLSLLVQNIVSRDEWATGNSIVIFLQGDGNRLVEAVEGKNGAAAELTVTYTTRNAAPSVDTGEDQYVSESDTVFLDAMVLDDGFPAFSDSVQLQWTVANGPGRVEFSDPASMTTNAGFSEAGTYQLLLTASDSQLSAFDAVTIHVSPSDR